MHESTTPATPYDVLGVDSAASMDDLRRAYRRRLRETHPDTGGEAIAFHAVQVAWEMIGTPADRAQFDNATILGSSRFPPEAPASPAPHEYPAPFDTYTPPPFGSPPASAPRAPEAPSGSSAYDAAAPPQWDTSAPKARHADPEPSARSHGHPGGWNREEYFHLMREWVGRGAKMDSPYDAAMIRSAPREIRHLMADAVAEEQSAKTLSRLGIAYTIWHDVGSDIPGPGPEQKIDHIVLGPTGLFALLSEDWGGTLMVRKGEIVSDMLAVGERPVASLARRTKAITRGARVKFTALAVVVPDGSTSDSFAVIGREKGVPTVVVQNSRLHEFMEAGLAGTPRLGADEIFSVRDRLQHVIRFV